MGSSWLLKRVVYIALLVSLPPGLAVAVVITWNRVVAFLNGGWPLWVGNVANVLQITTPIVAALIWWIAKTARSRSTEPGDGVMVRLLGFLALLLPARDRERFVGEVMADMADRGRWWQRVEELLSVARAVPGLAVIVRWARRRRA
jgi:hypothetical protein